jgi:hypothetical protein
MTTIRLNPVVKKFRWSETVATLFLLTVSFVTILLTGCITGQTKSPVIVSIKVLDRSGLVPITNAVLTAVHPLSSDYVEARTDTSGRAVLHFRFIAYRFAIGVHHQGGRVATITIVPDQATTNIVGEAWLDFETKIDARKGTIGRKLMLR